MEDLLKQLRELKLSGMADALSSQLEKPLNQTLSFEERMGFMLSQERQKRLNARLSRLIKEAGFKELALAEEIKYDNRGLNKQQILSLLQCNFIRQSQNVLITGATGCGKSYLASAIGHYACRLSFKVKYLHVPKFFETLQAEVLQLEKVNLSKFDLLILDDFGLTPMNQRQKHSLFNLIEERHKLKATIITSQLPVKSWHDYINEPTIADAIMDRLLETAHRIELSGSSLRSPAVMEYPTI